MNIGIGGAIFLWFMMLWPILVVLGYYAILRPQTTNAPALAVVSIVVGYSTLWPLTYFDSGTGWVGGLIYFASPPITTHLLARKFSKQGSRVID